MPWLGRYVPARVEDLVAGRRWVLGPLLGLPAGPELACPAGSSAVTGSSGPPNCLARGRGGIEATG